MIITLVWAIGYRAVWLIEYGIGEQKQVEGGGELRSVNFEIWWTSQGWYQIGTWICGSYWDWRYTFGRSQNTDKTIILAKSTEGACTGVEEEKSQGWAPKPTGGWRRKNEQRRPQKSLVGCRQPCHLLQEASPRSLDLRSLCPTSQFFWITLLCPFCLQDEHIWNSLLLFCCLSPLTTLWALRAELWHSGSWPDPQHRSCLAQSSTRRILVEWMSEWMKQTILHHHPQ